MFCVLIFFAKIVLLQSNIQTFAGYAVAPYVGAWIETAQLASHSASVASHPMWVRGLKHDGAHNSILLVKSHPMWVRGLKQSDV